MRRGDYFSSQLKLKYAVTVKEIETREK